MTNHHDPRTDPEEKTRPTRRDFVKGTGAVALGAGLGLWPTDAGGNEPPEGDATSDPFARPGVAPDRG